MNNIEKIIYNNKLIIIIDDNVVYLDLDIPIKKHLEKKIEYIEVNKIFKNFKIKKLILCKTQINEYICGGVLISEEKINKDDILKIYNKILEEIKKFV
jgi:hypothetical protein